MLSVSGLHKEKKVRGEKFRGGLTRPQFGPHGPDVGRQILVVILTAR
jgi:hypothetical protein